MPKIDNDFIKKNPDYDRVVLQLLFNRGIKTTEEIDYFFNDDYAKINDPFLFNQMEEVVDLVIKNIKEENKITVYGDYDADGVTSTALMYEILNLFKADVDFYIPDRFEEGIGLNKEAIKKLKNNGTKLIITVDGGIVSKKEVEYAKEIGIKIIITDHHTPRVDSLPDTLIINPLTPGEKYPFKSLAGVCVAQKLREALIKKSKLNDEMKERLINKGYDLIAVGLVADCMSLVGENRILLKKGMEELNKTNRIGLLELMKVSKINGELDSWNVGFQIAPRINAAGRLVHAKEAVKLLTTKDIKEAKEISNTLNDLNIKRQQITGSIVDEADKQIIKEDKILICLSPKDDIWTEGVIGLAASRVCDKYHKPTLIITRTEEGLKGSGRSIKEFNVIKAIEECSEHLEKYGGHPGACGFSLKEENFDKFTKKIKKIALEKLKDLNLVPTIEIDTKLELEEANEDLIERLDKFKPFGVDNSKPNFLTQGVQIKDIMTMGINKQHIKFRINSHWALAWNKAEQWKEYKIGDKIDIVYYLEINEFNGRRDVQMKLMDIKATDDN